MPYPHTAYARGLHGTKISVIIPYIPDSSLELFLQEPLLSKFSIDPKPLVRELVACNGARFCDYGSIETKNQALKMTEELARELNLARPIRIHWTGCPNCCGQPQIADIGLIGLKTKDEGEVVEAVDIYMRHPLANGSRFGRCVMKKIPCKYLKPTLRNLLIKNFGAQPL